MALLVFLASPAINQAYERPDIPLRFAVLDADTGRPVPNADVKLVEFNRANYRAPATGRDGQTAITLGFKCCSNSALFGKSRHIIYSFWEVDVEAAGYATLSSALTGFTGENCFHDADATPPPITLRLHRKAERGSR
jgi:hypothetical protein